MDKLEVLVDMSFGRLEFPYELTGKARENYREYIRKNLGDIAEYLVKQEDMHRLEVISSQKLWTLEGIDSALDCASKRKETEVSAFLMNERANLVDNTAGSERIDVDKLQNSQEADRTEQGKNEQSQTTEKSLNRRTILRKKHRHKAVLINTHGNCFTHCRVRCYRTFKVHPPIECTACSCTGKCKIIIFK